MVLSEKWSKLKSGSDIRGTASEGVPGQPVELTDETAERIARGFVRWLSSAVGKAADKLKVSLGHDSRISAPRLETCVSSALSASGALVYRLGLSSTPSMFMSTIDEKIDADGAIMLTASHHPFNKNGLKFFTKKGGLEGADITKILEYAQEGGFVDVESPAQPVKCNFIDTYALSLVEKVRSACGENTPLSGLKIVVDAGNGAGGFFAEKVLEPLGADTSGSQFLEPDGNFPNHIPNPENAEAMQAICGCVVSNNADLGIIFDTDVDRAGLVFKGGKEINRNRLIALVSAILLREQPGAVIVTDSITSDGLSDFIAAKGGVHHRFKRGYKNVINEAVRLNGEGKHCPLAIETSGHAAFKENRFLDDGAYLVTRVLIELAQQNKAGGNIEDLIAGLKSPLEEAEIRLGFTVKDFSAHGKVVLDALERYCRGREGCLPAAVNYEGFRASVPAAEGWFLLRMSLHDPIMPLNMESEKAGGTKQIARELLAFLSEQGGLELSALKKFVDTE